MISWTSVASGNTVDGLPMKGTPIRIALMLAMVLAVPREAFAHGVAGNRNFDCALTFDDPAVADEVIVPLYQNPQLPGAGR